MDFKVADLCAEKNIKKGFWKPEFKSRFNNDYFDFSNRENYEKELRNRLFKNESDKIVILPNAYPFILSVKCEQFVIWINDANKDPGIEKIATAIEQAHPQYDYHVLLNSEKYRSIKSILHYHAIIKLKEIPVKLTKLIIFHRHGNREAIVKFPIFDNTPYNFDASLLDIGKKNAYQFGKDIKNIYKIDQHLFNKFNFTTSPVKRCEETLENILNGLEINHKVYHWTKLYFGHERSVYQIIDQNPEMKLMNEKYSPLIEKICKLFNIPENEKYSCHFLYDIHSSIQCYKDTCSDIINKFLTPELDKEINDATTESYNLFIQLLSDHLSSQLKNIIDEVNNNHAKFSICSTHDTLVFSLAKYLANKNNIKYNFELPHYLSNIRIETWSDNSHRIYYNNWYLGTIFN